MYAWRERQFVWIVCLLCCLLFCSKVMLLFGYLFFCNYIKTFSIWYEMYFCCISVKTKLNWNTNLFDNVILRIDWHPTPMYTLHNSFCLIMIFHKNSFITQCYLSMKPKEALSEYKWIHNDWILPLVSLPLTISRYVQIRLDLSSNVMYI